MYMEELISHAYLRSYEYSLSVDDISFLSSIHYRIERGNPLTTRQGFAITKLLKSIPQWRKLPITAGEVHDLLHDPQWRQPLVQSLDIKPEVRHLGDNLLGFRGTTRRMEADLKTLKASFSKGMRIVAVKNTKTLDNVISMLGRHSIGIDPATEKWLADALSYRSQPTTMVAHEDDLVIDIPGDVFGDPLLNCFALRVLGADFL